MSHSLIRHLLAMALLALLPLTATAAKDGYKITLQIDRCNDSVISMCYYYAQDLFYVDTAFNDGRGRFLFEGKRKLHPGLYYFSNGKDQYLDFVIYNNETRFTIHTNAANWQRHASAKGSEQNQIFYTFSHLNEQFHQEIDEAKLQLDSTEFNDHYLPRQIQRFDSTRMAFIQQYPDAMISRMMLATLDQPVPTTFPDGTPMTDRQRYDWKMAHYFDQFPLDDDFIIRTPKNVFYRKVMEYLDVHMKNLPPEIICPLLDSMIDRSEKAPEVFKWLVYNITTRFLQSKVMVYDEVYVHLVQRYIATGKATWMTPSGIDKEVERATKWERLLVGRQAPELILFDTTRRAWSLHHMPGRYTLLLFWSPTCGHCRDIIPAVHKVYRQYADSLQLSAFSILTEPDDQTLEKWKQFMVEHGIDHPRWISLPGGEANVDWREVYDVHTTPQIYLIDNKDQKILAKKLGADILEMLCKELLKNKETK